MIVKPSPTVLWLLGLAVSFGFIFSLITLIAKSGFVYGAILFSGSAFIWLYAGSIRINLYRSSLEMKRFWRRSWIFEIKNIVVKDGRAGDFSVIPAIIFIDRASGKRVGEILKSQFRISDLVALREVVHVRGGEVVDHSVRSKVH